MEEKIKRRQEEKINHIVGTLILKEKYKFLPSGLVGEIVRDTFKEESLEFGEPRGN